MDKLDILYKTVTKLNKNLFHKKEKFKMAYIQELKDTNGETMYPVTKTNAVYDINGYRLSDSILTVGGPVEKLEDIKINADSCNGVVLGIDGDGNPGYYKADGSFSPFSKSKAFRVKAVTTSTAGSLAKTKLTVTDLNDKVVSDIEYDHVTVQSNPAVTDWYTLKYATPTWTCVLPTDSYIKSGSGTAWSYNGNATLNALVVLE